MARPAPTYLQLHLPDRWLPQSAGVVPVRYGHRTGVRVEDGAALLADVAPADEITVVVPATRIAFVRTVLPAVRGAALAKVLAFAVEDAVVSAPEEIHAVVMVRAADGDALVAVIERAWFEAMLDALADAGLAPQRVIAESAFAMGPADQWLVVWSENGGFLGTGGPETIALDATADAAAPVALRVALHEARKSGTAPAGIRVYSASGYAAPDAAAWTASLRLPVTAQGRWAPEAQDARRLDAVDLLAGTSAGAKADGTMWRRFVPALAVAAVVLVAHVALTVFDWARRASEERTLRQAMESQFRAAFPEATKVVDPALQMQRNLSALRRAAGEPDPGDALPLAARAAAPLAASGQRVQALRYDSGQMEIDLPAAAGPATLRTLFQSQAPGLAVSADADPRRGVTVVRIRAGER